MLSSNALTVIAFYTIIILLISYFRKKFEFHGWIKFLELKFPLVAQLKTKLGLKLMKKIGDDHPVIVNRIANLGIYVGYAGMVVVLGFIIHGVYQLFADPSAPATFTPVIPGAKIPGSPIAFPFWHTIIALFVTVVIHEFSHGVVSRANKIPIQSSGYAQVGPFSAAFVEPDEKMLEKAPRKVQNAIFAAGPWSNFLTAGLMILLLSFVFTPISQSFYGGSTLSFESVIPDSPAERAGLDPNLDYAFINGEPNASLGLLFNELQNASTGDTLTLISEDNKEFNVILGERNNQTYIGIEGIKTNIIPTINPQAYKVYDWIQELFVWIFILSIGLGMGNLIPAGPVDGGRMYLIACQHFFGKKKGEKIWSKTATVLFILIIALFLVPIIRALL